MVGTPAVPVRGCTPAVRTPAASMVLVYVLCTTVRHAAWYGFTVMTDREGYDSQDRRTVHRGVSWTDTDLPCLIGNVDGHREPVENNI